MRGNCRWWRVEEYFGGIVGKAHEILAMLLEFTKF